MPQNLEEDVKQAGEETQRAQAGVPTHPDNGTATSMPVANQQNDIALTEARSHDEAGNMPHIIVIKPQITGGDRALEGEGSDHKE